MKPEAERRLALLFRAALARVEGLAGGSVVVTILVDHSGQVSGSSRVTVDEFPLSKAGRQENTGAKTDA